MTVATVGAKSVRVAKAPSSRRNFLASDGSVSTDDVLTIVQKEGQEMRKTVQKDMISKKIKMKEHLSVLMQERLEPSRSESELRSKKERVAELQQEKEELAEKVDQTFSTTNGLERLAMFRQVNISSVKMERSPKPHNVFDLLNQLF